MKIKAVVLSAILLFGSFAGSVGKKENVADNHANSFVNDSNGNVARNITALAPLDVNATFSGTVESGPIQFKLNAVDTFVSQDTVTPTNNKSLPVDLYDVNGQRGILANPLVCDSSGFTQPVSAASLPLPVGAATSALQTAGNSSLSSIDGKITTTVNGIKVDGSAVTQPISAASLPLPPGASTAANQATGNASLASIDGKITVVNTGAVTITSSALPTGAATSALQTTGNSSLSSIDGKLNSLGQKTMANSVPVVLASDQSAIPVSQSGIWNINNISGIISLPTGAATEATLSTAAASLSVLDDWDESDRAKVNPIVGQAGVQGGSGAVTALTQRMTLATDVALPTGTNSIGQVTANAGTNLNTSALNLEATQSTVSTRIGDVAETAPVSDTASSGLNGRLQRIAQRITSLIALVPTSLGQKTMANSFAVTIASDQSFIPGAAVFTIPAPSLSSGNTSVLQVDSKASLFVNTDGRKNTYRATIVNLAGGASVTDLLTVTGSATKTIRIRKIVLQAVAGANQVIDVVLIKRSTADTGGTSTSVTMVPVDSNDAAATAVVTAYTANPTLGTTVGNVDARKAFLPGSNNGPTEPTIFDFGDNASKAIVLRGTAEQLAINLNGLNVASDTYNITVDETEE